MCLWLPNPDDEGGINSYSAVCFLEKVSEKFDFHIEINGNGKIFFFTPVLWWEKLFYSLFNNDSTVNEERFYYTYYFRNKKILLPRFFFHSSFRTTLDLKIRKKGLRNRKPHKGLLILPLPTTFSSLQMSNE